MNCPRCNQAVEPGAAFCGNCGQALSKAAPAAASATAPAWAPAGVPAYALGAPAQHSGETKALLSLIFGVVALPAALIPILGLVLSIIGLVLGTLTRHSSKRALSTIGITVSGLAIIAGVGSWTYAFVHYKDSLVKNTPSTNSAAVATGSIKTPCYDIEFIQPMNTDSDKQDSCDTRAYDGPAIEQSSNVYKVYGNQVIAVSSDNFYSVAKAALEKDVSSTLPGFTIDGERSAEFAGSPAYIVNASDRQNQIAVVEAAVFHEGAAGYNLFSLVHATKGTTTDLKALEAHWQWK